MSSLLDGIEFEAKTTAKGHRSKPNGQLIKALFAVAILVLAGVFFAMQAGMIPSPFGGRAGPQTARSPGATQLTETERREIQDRLDREEADFIAKGGHKGSA